MDSYEEEDGAECKELVRRLKESENSYKLFGFSHVIIIGSITNVMDSTLRLIMDGMYRRTKSHCKTDLERDHYQQQLCKLYLTYLKNGLAHIDLLEPKLARILSVKTENPNKNTSEKLADLRAKVAERTKRVQSLTALQSRLKTDFVMAEWVISKVEPILNKAENDLAAIECISSDDVSSILNNLNRAKSMFNSLKFD